MGLFLTLFLPSNFFGPGITNYRYYLKCKIHRMIMKMRLTKCSLETNTTEVVVPEPVGGKTGKPEKRKAAGKTSLVRYIVYGVSGLVALSSS